MQVAASFSPMHGKMYSQTGDFIVVETKSDEARANRVSRFLSFHNFKVAALLGKRGRMWLFWKNELEMMYYTEGTSNYFHSLFKLKPNQPEVLITGVHAPSVTGYRHQFRNSLQTYLSPHNFPWMILGDMNEVTNQSEKMGGRVFNPNKCADFNKFTNETCMVDLGFHGNPYNWNNAREGLSLIRERLDRILAKPSWLNTYPATQVFYLPKTYSDHCPILVTLSNDDYYCGVFPFCCQETWLLNNSFSSFSLIIGWISLWLKGKDCSNQPLITREITFKILIFIKRKILFPVLMVFKYFLLNVILPSWLLLTNPYS